MSSPDDLSKFVVKQEVKADTFAQAASSLAGGEGGSDGAIFNPMEAVAAGMRSGNIIVQMLKVCALLFARGIIAPVEVVLRHKFGERYFNAMVSLVVLSLLLFFHFVLGIVWFYPILIGVVYVGLSAFNKWLCFDRDRKGDYWHSYSEGESWIRIPKLDAAIAKQNFTFDVSTLFIEPAVTFLAGLFCLVFPGRYILVGIYYVRINPLAFYLLVAGVTLFVYQLYCYIYRRNLLLDEKDNSVIAEIRGRIAAPAENVGMFTHKGVTYTVLGGKKEWKK